jgi:nucleotide-binding universal stress UspA family protein
MHASYIVLGTKSKGGVAHAIQGSISEYVIHHAPCPVLVVPASLAPPPEPDADDEGL